MRLVFEHTIKTTFISCAGNEPNTVVVVVAVGRGVAVVLAVVVFLGERVWCWSCERRKKMAGGGGGKKKQSYNFGFTPDDQAFPLKHLLHTKLNNPRVFVMS
jgi:hypothetical protein